MQILITGREQILSVAEAESLFGNVEVINSGAIAVNYSKDIDINMLGGSIKTAKLLHRLKKSNPQLLIDLIIDHIKSDKPKSKFNFGISYYAEDKFKINNLGIAIKRNLQKTELKPRLVNGNNNVINAASIKHNKLTTTGYEFLIIKSSLQTILAITTSAQDVDSYSKRDYDKPCRNNKVGMLPPKLSQILINLARPENNSIVVDPFCGSGGLLMEAALMGYQAEGSDISPDMTECSRQNAAWFEEEFSPNGTINILENSDATIRDYPISNFVIVSEGYLGQNYTKQPNLDDINSQLPILTKLYLDFFKHIDDLPNKPSTICICTPFWLIDNNKHFLNIIDVVTDLGYTKSEFKSVRPESLEYYRQGQYTGRQINIFRNN